MGIKFCSTLLRVMGLIYWVNKAEVWKVLVRFRHTILLINTCSYWTSKQLEMVL